MSEKTIRVGIIGAGENTKTRHIPGLQALTNVKIVGVCNKSIDSAYKVAEEFSISSVYENWYDVIYDDNVDAIVIGTWPYLHAPATLLALECEKHVLCEARMAMNAEEALKLGLVNYVVPEDKLEEESNKFAQKFANLSGVILSLTKRAAMQGIDNDFEEVLQKVEYIYNREMMSTKDAQEGLQSFMEKRAPIWQNK